MTKKDYAAVANVFNMGLYVDISSNKKPSKGFALALGCFILYAKEENPRFNVTKFLDAVYKDIDSNIWKTLI